MAWFAVRGPVAGVLSAIAVLLACRAGPRDATAGDAAEVRAACAAQPDYDPVASAGVVAALDAHLGGKRPDFRRALKDVCYFSKKRYFAAYTTFRSRADHSRREKLCEALRTTGKTGLITPVYLHCADGARCTVCRQGSGGHR